MCVRACTANVYICIGLCVRACTCRYIPSYLCFFFQRSLVAKLHGKTADKISAEDRRRQELRATLANF